MCVCDRVMPPPRGRVRQVREDCSMINWQKIQGKNLEERPSTLDAKKGRPITLYAAYKKTIRKL